MANESAAAPTGVKGSTASDSKAPESKGTACFVVFAIMAAAAGALWWVFKRRMGRRE